MPSPFTLVRLRVKAITAGLETEPFVSRNYSYTGRVAWTRDVRVQGGGAVEIGSVWRGLSHLDGQPSAEYVTDLRASRPATRWLLDTCVGPQVAIGFDFQDNGRPELPILWEAEGTTGADNILAHLQAQTGRIILMGSGAVPS